ncbi:hypothetical protein DH2020_027858 [Rehmannia glutinosa]|uniref:Chlorophyllase n=1 Tax=Rehmannia glutinosa TaxID=99300 RepID=A0ABR0VTZ4_REHGL
MFIYNRAFVYIYWTEMLLILDLKINERPNCFDLMGCHMSEPYDVFKTGNYEVTKIIVKTSDASKPPTELFIVAPVLKGTYPVLLFCHGFLLANTCYTSLLQHIASHGYIVVAPKFYGIPWISMTEEIKKAALVTEWLSTGLPVVLPEKVTRDIQNLALSGHTADGVNSSSSLTSKPPSCYFLARDYGHCDMLDDTLDDWNARRVRSVCKSGKGSKDLMRRSVGGIVVAFLKSYLGGDEDDLNAIVDDPSIAPITLDPVIYVKE